MRRAWLRGGSLLLLLGFCLSAWQFNLVSYNASPPFSGLLLVVSTRNDSESAMQRLRYWVDSTLYFARKHHIEPTLAVVEYNPCSTRPSLEQVPTASCTIRFSLAPQELRVYPEVKVLTVSSKAHEKAMRGQGLICGFLCLQVTILAGEEAPDFLEYAGKNVALRQLAAQHSYILTTNPDAILSPAVWRSVSELTRRDAPEDRFKVFR